MSDGLRQHITDTIAEHTHSCDFRYCYCGLEFTRPDWETEWSAHLADQFIERLGLREVPLFGRKNGGEGCYDH